MKKSYAAAFAARCGILAILLLLAVGSVAAAGNTEAALRKVDDFPLYVMNYDGDYKLAAFLRQGAENLRELNVFLAANGLTAGAVGDDGDAACSCFKAVTDANGVLYGRNYDLKLRPPALLLYTHPPDGYASVSMVNLNTLRTATGKDFGDIAANLRAAPYFPADGMNEHGVAAAIMTVPASTFARDPAKITLLRWQVVRLILDRARTVAEAIALLERHNVNVAALGPGVHFFVADATGDSAVIEYIDGGMQVIRSDDPWQAATNFLLYDGRGVGKKRYARLAQTLSSGAGSFTEARAMELLAAVSLDTTRWSVVYNLSAREIGISLGKQYETVRKFTIGPERGGRAL